MSTDAETKALLQRFVEALQLLSEFDTDLYSKKLLQASKVTHCLQYFPQFAATQVEQAGTIFDGEDCKEHINLLAAASTARCLANISDDYGFHDSVDKDKALDISKRAIAKLITFMYGEHVNKHLHAKGVPSLIELKNRSGFLDAYHNLLLSSPFDHNALAHNVGRNYTIALLYCYEYFKHGPGFNLSELLEEEGKEMKHWVEIFRSWVSHSQDEKFKAAHPNFKIEALIPSTGAIFALRGYPDADIKALADHLHERVVGDMIKWEISEEVKQYQILGQMIWASWDSRTTDYENAVHSAVNESKDTYIPGGPGRGDMPNPGFISTSYGDGVDQYMQAFWETGLFKQRAGNRHRIDGGSSTSGCFRPGTKVLTSSGPRNIEDLREGDKVLTKGGRNPQWGQCSDEQVVHSTTTTDNNRILLWGFNGQRPFFSANHVFHTTTGLRALDPYSAKLENPWLEVGRLQVGHSVIWTPDGTQYEPVSIESLSSTVADCPAIYGVHLREGLRSYHADGYLVHLNYPEITIKSISKLLQGFDASTREMMLRSLSELQPLFERFGAKTLMTAFNGQLQDKYTDRHTLQALQVTGVKSPLQSGVEHLRRGWSLTDDDPKELVTRNIDLPVIEVFEGVATIDGSYCERATVKKDLIIWSRELPGQGWEHGYIKLDSLCLAGRGGIYYSLKFDALVDTKARIIIASPKKLNVPAEIVMQNTISSASAQKILGRESAVPITLAREGTFAAAQVQASLEIPASPEGAHALVADDILTVEMTSIQAQKADSNSIQQQAISESAAAQPAVAQKWEEIDAYTISYDKAEWTKDDPVIKDPAKYLDIFTTIDEASRIYLCRIPQLDAIRDAAFADAQKRNMFNDVDEFYTCYTTKNVNNGNTIYEFECTRAQVIASLADKFDKTAARYENLTFKNLGLDIELPFIFSVMRVELSFDAMDITGIVRQFNADAAGDEGRRHRINGQWTDTPAPIVRANVVSMTVGSTTGAPLETMTMSHMAPSLQLSAIAEANDNTRAPANDGIGAKELRDMKIPVSIQEDTQKMIYRTMLYHMDENERKKLVGAPRPEVGDDDIMKVPAELGPNLEAGTRNWLRTTYIPAWIATRINQVADMEKSLFRKKLDNAQRRRLKYWWEGKGPQCMSKSDYYNRLNALAARHCTFKAIPRLRVFANDPNLGTTEVTAASTQPSPDKPKQEMRKVATTGLSGGKRWAAALYNLMGVGPAMHNLAQNLGNMEESKHNDLQTLGNIMQALDPIPIAVPEAGWTDDNSPYCIRLAENVRRFRAKKDLRMPWVGLSNDPFIQNEYQFLHDAMRELWINLLEGNKGFGDEVTAMLKKDLEALCKELEISQNEVAAKKAEMALEMTRHMIQSGAVFARAANDMKLKERLGNAWRGRGLVAAVAVADHARENADLEDIKDKVKADKVKAFAYSAMVVATLSMYTCAAVTAYKGWTYLKDADRAKLVLGSVQQALHTIGQGRDAYKSILDYRASKDKLIAATAAEASITHDNLLMHKELSDLFGEENMIPTDFLEKKKTHFGELEAREIDIEVRKLKEQGNYQEFDAPEEPIPEGRKYNIKGNRLRMCLVALGAAIVIAACFSIYQNWGEMDAVNATMAIANAVVQALSVAVEVVFLLADIGFKVGAKLLTICSWAGPILALVGVVLMAITMIIFAFLPKPLSDFEKWMDEHGYAYVNKLPDPAKTQLSWKITPEKLQTMADNQTVTIRGTNSSSTEVKLASITTSFTCGTSKSSLFRDEKFKAPFDVTPPGGSDPTGRFDCIASSDELRKTLNLGYSAGAPVHGEKDEVQTTWQLSIRRKLAIGGDASEKKEEKVILKPNQWVSFTITGRTGEPYPNEFYCEVVEEWDGDSVSDSAYIKRDK